MADFVASYYDQDGEDDSSASRNLALLKADHPVSVVDMDSIFANAAPSEMPPSAVRQEDAQSACDSLESCSEDDDMQIAVASFSALDPATPSLRTVPLSIAMREPNAPFARYKPGPVAPHSPANSATPAAAAATTNMTAPRVNTSAAAAKSTADTATMASAEVRNDPHSGNENASIIASPAFGKRSPTLARAQRLGATVRFSLRKLFALNKQ